MEALKVALASSKAVKSHSLRYVTLLIYVVASARPPDLGGKNARPGRAGGPGEAQTAESDRERETG